MGANLIPRVINIIDNVILLSAVLSVQNRRALFWRTESGRVSVSVAVPVARVTLAAHVRERAGTAVYVA